MEQSRFRRASLSYRPTARPGARAPHSWVQWHGQRISTIDTYDGGFILLTGPDNAGWVRAADRVRAELAVPIRVLGLGTDLSPAGELIADLLKRYGLEPSGAVLIPARRIRRLPLGQPRPATSTRRWEARSHHIPGPD